MAIENAVEKAVEYSLLGISALNGLLSSWNYGGCDCFGTHGV